MEEVSLTRSKALENDIDALLKAFVHSFEVMIVKN
jgi:hypothetical protein